MIARQITVMETLDDDGNPVIRTSYSDDDMTLVDLLGLLEAGKLQLSQNFIRPQEDS